MENNYKEIHQSAIVVDLHNDYMEERMNHPEHRLYSNYKHHTDVARLKEGGVNVQFFVIWTRPDDYRNHFARAIKLIDILNRDIDECHGKIKLAGNYSDIMSIVDSKKIAAVLCLEGGQLVGRNINNINRLYERGMRYLTLAWNYGTEWCGGANDDDSKGLSEFGKQVIDRLNALGVMIDVSHVNKKSLEDVLNYTDRTVIATHSGAYGVNESKRNLCDEHIKEIARRGGVIGSVFYPYFLNNTDKATIKDVIKHINYIRDITGSVDCIALGSDFDGIDITPTGLENVSKFPNLTQALVNAGYTEYEIIKILGTNALRVFKNICG
ncbi:MAG: dipeptidase [Prevotellaceae bacterium]|jgi:membrane dipeptidase|nr:dipeptidase [Prevotellaceae bacterium]